MNAKNDKVLLRLTREGLLKGSLAVTGMGALFLLSNLEMGTVGNWAKVAQGGIVCFWMVLIAYAKWMERDKLRRDRRQLHRIEERILDSENRSFFLRETLAA